MVEPLMCSRIAKMVGSGHKCSKKTAKKKGNTFTTYSTHCQGDIQLLWALLCKKNKAPKNEYGRRLSRRDVVAIENEFSATQFCMCKFFTRNLRECIRILPPTKKRKASVLDQPCSAADHPFVIAEDDNSDEEYVCNLINRQDSSPASSNDNMTINAAVSLSASSDSSSPPPQSLIRRRSPRNSNSSDPSSCNSSEGNLAPAMLQFNISPRHHGNKRMRKSTEARFKDMLKDFGCCTMRDSTPLRKKITELSDTVHNERTMNAV